MKDKINSAEIVSVTQQMANSLGKNKSVHIGWSERYSNDMSYDYFLTMLAETLIQRNITNPATIKCIFPENDEKYGWKIILNGNDINYIMIYPEQA